MKNFLISILFATATVPLAGAADPVPATNSVVISTEFINRLLIEARLNNPSLKAADHRVRAAALNASAVRTWEDPMAMVGGSLYSDRGFRPSEDGDLAYGVEQKLPLWGRPKLARRVAESETFMREAEVNYRFQQLRTDITKALMVTALAERIVDVGAQDLAWLEATAKATENKYRAGQSSVADTLQIQNELAKRNDMLRTEHQRLGHQYLTLNRLLNRPAGSPWPAFQLPEVAPAIPISEKLLFLARRNEPKLKVLEQEIKQAEAAAELTLKARRPDVSVGVEARQYSGDGGFRSGMFSLRFSLPWVNGGKYRKDYERDQEKQQSAVQEREDQLLGLREQLHHLAVNIEASRREALLNRDEIATRAQQALTSRLTEWESGRGSFRDVLDARRMALDSQLMSARAVAEEHEMLAEMLLWTGLENLESLTRLANEPSLFPEHDLGK